MTSTTGTRTQGRTGRRTTRGGRRPRPRAARLTARTADRYVLYQQAVQTPDADVHFVDRVYRKLHGTVPAVLREDFCGTGLMAGTWAARRPTNVAHGVDIDPVPLAWGARHVLPSLGDAAGRVHLVRGDVRSVRVPPCDVVVALNFSYSCFTTRADLVAYLRQARRQLRPGGLMVLDAFGGPDAMIEITERRRKKGFTYEWEQESFDPISHALRAHISFLFPDGTRLRRAFSYDWRLWTLPELRAALEDAGFARVRFYFETIGRDGRGTGIFRETARAEACESFVCCLVAETA